MTRDTDTRRVRRPDAPFSARTSNHPPAANAPSCILHFAIFYFHSVFLYRFRGASADHDR